MHLRTDRPVFRRFFIIGCDRRVAALHRRVGDAARRARTPESTCCCRPPSPFPRGRPTPTSWLHRRAVRGRVRDRSGTARARARRARARRSSPASRSRAGRCGVFAMWVASDWPIHDVAERYNFSVHMVQHLMFTDDRGAAAAARHAGLAAAAGPRPALAVRHRALRSRGSSRRRSSSTSCWSSRHWPSW